MTQVLKATLRAPKHPRIAVLSGPSFATEVATKLPTAVTLAGDDAELVRWLQGVLMAPYFRVYSGTVHTGQHVLMGCYDEMFRFLERIGSRDLVRLQDRLAIELAEPGRPASRLACSGVGDLVLTCTGPLSRNHTVGVRLGRGERLQDILSTMHAVAEGVRTCRAAQGLAERYVVDMPIVQEVHAVLFDGKSCRRAVSDLMERSAKDELGRG